MDAYTSFKNVRKFVEMKARSMAIRYESMILSNHIIRQFGACAGRVGRKGGIAVKIIRKAVAWLCMFLVVAGLAVAGVIGMQGYAMYRQALDETPLQEKIDAVRAQDGYTPLDELPPIYAQAVVAAEDRRFYDHGGFDFTSTVRAALTNLRTGSLAEGGSTLTQQLAKNLYFSQEKKFTRKVAELFMAFAIERTYSKDDILELYINVIYYGDGCTGIQAAAQHYFGKEPSELTDYECTLLAGVPNAPSVYAPTVNPELCAQRQRQVLDGMVDAGYLTAQQADTILQQGSED